MPWRVNHYWPPWTFASVAMPLVVSGKVLRLICLCRYWEKRHSMRSSFADQPLNRLDQQWRRWQRSTMVCEVHCRILGFAHVQERPSHTMWDVSYLASMLQRNVSSDDVLTALLEYMLEMAAGHGILRVFARVEDEIPEQDLFQRAGIQ